MFPVTEKVKINGKDVICKDLTYGFIVKLQSGEVIETKHDIIIDGTGLTTDEIFKLRNCEVEKLYLTVSKLTYPQYYDDKGNPIELTVDEDVDEGKKKV